MLIKDVIKEHLTYIEYGLKNLDIESIQSAVDLIDKTIGTGGRIFVVGNGGSAAIAQHWACDYFKGCSDMEKQIFPQVISLAANIPLMTAISNDIGYDEVYSYQLERLDLDQEKDILIAISSSGSSPNVMNAISVATEYRCKTIALVGFDGGQIKKYDLPHHVIHVNIQEYEAVEDCHQAIMHIFAKYIRSRFNGRN